MSMEVGRLMVNELGEAEFSVEKSNAVHLFLFLNQYFIMICLVYHELLKGKNCLIFCMHVEAAKCLVKVNGL